MRDSGGDVAVGANAADVEAHGWEVVVGGIGGGFEAEGQTAGPAGEAGPLPSADDGVRDGVGAAENGFAAADGKGIDPVCGDQAAGVEVGDALVELGVPGVLNFEVGVGVVYVGKDAAVVAADTLGLRAVVKRLREGIADVDRQPVGSGMAEGELERVVGAVADRVHGVKGGELIAPEGGLVGAAVEGTAGEDAKDVGDGQRKRSPLV